MSAHIFRPRPHLGSRVRARLFHAYFRFSRGLTFGAQGCILDQENRVFLIRHTYIPGWHFPGGGVETGESSLEALERELSEEGNILLTARPQLFSLYFNRNMSVRDHIALYVVRDFQQTAPRKPDREIAEAAFFPLDDLPAQINAATRRRLDEILNNLAPDPVW